MSNPTNNQPEELEEIFYVLQKHIKYQLTPDEYKLYLRMAKEAKAAINLWHETQVQERVREARVEELRFADSVCHFHELTDRIESLTKKESE
jgi:hypothetical protein